MVKLGFIPFEFAAQITCGKCVDKINQVLLDSEEYRRDDIVDVRIDLPDQIIELRARIPGTCTVLVELFSVCVVFAGKY